MIVRPRILPGRLQWLGSRRAAALLYRQFHASTSLRDEGGMQNHYKTLGIEPTASAAEVKKKFYTLSKTHHPDHNPHDPSASKKFMAISEAYATLGSSEKRTRYDRDFFRTMSPSHSGAAGAGGTTYHGSYSSHSSPAGGRPASGLSRRRTQFKGPPPSFFRAGGWGNQSAKRADAASRPSHAHEGFSGGGGNAEGQGAAADDELHSRGYANDAPGTGPSGFSQGWDNDVPHFDRASHLKTQESVQRMRHRARRRQGVVREEDLEAEVGGQSSLVNFLVVSGVLAAVIGLTGLVAGAGAPPRLPANRASMDKGKA